MTKRYSFFDWKGLLLIFLLMIGITGLDGEFPLNDDWIFASGVKALLERGELDYLGPSGPNLILQALWGWLCCSLGGGFSFVTLRLSTLLLSWLGIFAMYKLALTVCKEKRWAFMAGLLLLFNPIYYNLSFSFMTDVPFTALALVSIWQYAFYFDRRKAAFRITGALAAIAAFLIRQPGLMIWVAVELVLLFQQGASAKNRRQSILYLASAIAVFFVVEVGLKGHLSGDYIRPEDSMLFQNPLMWSAQFIKRCGMSIFYLGLLTVPLLPAVIRKVKQEEWWRRGWFWGLFGFNIFLALSLAWGLDRFFPFSGYTIYNFGLGTPLLADFHYHRQHGFPQLPSWLVLSVGIIIQVYSFLILKIAIERFQAIRPGQQGLNSQINLSSLDKVLLVFGALYILTMFIWSFFDRYMLMLFALALCFILRAKPAWMSFRWPGLAILLGLAWYSVAGTHDYLSWNGAVAEKKNALMESLHLPREKIDAGYAQDGWDTGRYDSEKAVFVIAWGNMEGFSISDTFSYHRWLPGRSALYVLKKNPALLE